MPALSLGAVVALGLGGRTTGPAPAPRGSEAPVVALAPSPPVVEVAPSPPAVRVRPAPPAGMQREEGTDGLMGRLPFGLDGDTPLVPVGADGRSHLNRFTIDDVRAAWSALDTTPPWVRRLGGLPNFRTDPYQR